MRRLRGGKVVLRHARVTLVRFRLDGRRNGSDRRRPFVVGIDGARLKAGRHRLVADVSLRLPHGGRGQHRRLVLKFRAC
jgi:hypothetical protein